MMLTLREVAVQLRISPATTWRLVQSGDLPAITLGASRRRRLLRIREESLEQYLRSCEHTRARETAR